MTHYPHPYDPKNKARIIRKWRSLRKTKCPIVGFLGKEKQYVGQYVEYTFINKKGKTVHVPEYCMKVTWLEECRGTTGN